MSRPQQFGPDDVEILEEEQLYRGFYEMRAYRLAHAGYSGNRVTIRRELMLRPDAVVVLPYDPRTEEVILIEQYRVGGGKVETPWLIECVAGLIHPGESEEAVARREAEEEAGITLGRIRRLYEYLPSPGACDERVTLFIGEVDASTASGVHGLADEGEDILVHRVSVARALDWLAEGHINNAASIIALQWLASHQRTLQEEWTGS